MMGFGFLRRPSESMGRNNNGISNQTPIGKVRFKVTLHVPQNNKTRTIIVPAHPQNDTILSLRQAAISRAAKLGFSLPADSPEPYACLGEIDGGQLCDDDVLDEVILDPTMEEIWFVFAEPSSDDAIRAQNVNQRLLPLNPRNFNGTNSSTHDVHPLLNLCIITPELAKTKNRLEDIPKLPAHFGITRKSTLQKLKEVIGKHYFGVDLISGGLGSSGGPESGECNCLLARKLLRGGTREHVSFIREGNGGNLKCDICLKGLSEPCPQCAELVNDEDDDDSGIQMMRCGTYLMHVGCHHVFHQHCSEDEKRDYGCPARDKEHPTDTHDMNKRPREYIPAIGTNRFLVVIYGRSKVVKVPLPPLSFAGSSSTEPTSRSLSFSDFKNVLKTTLGKECNFNYKVAHVFGATSTTIPQTNSSTSTSGSQAVLDSQLVFEYSCIVSICSIKKHPLSPRNNTSSTLPQIIFCDLSLAAPEGIEDTAISNAGNSNLKRPVDSPELQYDIDIHTTDAPIICSGEEIELGQLHLDDCAVGTVINLFVTLRSRDKPREGTESDEDDLGNVHGMDEIFKNRDHWRLPFNQSERGLATFLSSTRVFASKIANADKPTQNSILALFMRLTHFPPILRSLYTLMMGRTLTPAESAVLVQCVYELTKELITPGHIIENKKERVLEGSRLFYYLALELAQRFYYDPAATQYLDAMKHVSLMDAETFQPLKDPITTNLGIIETAYFKALTEGLLSGLANVVITPPKEDEMRVLKLVKRTAGTMTSVTVFDNDVLQLALENKPRHLIAGQLGSGNQSIITTCPRELNYNIQELCQQSAVGTFAVVPPMNLRSQSIKAPTLTLDSDGLMAVYVGRPPCAPPDKDVTIFRPTRGGAVNIDVSLVTQLLEPILKQRTEDRSIALESLGEAEAKAHRTPSEIVVLCVDCSESMQSTAGFEEINEDQEEHEESDEDTQSSDKPDINPEVMDEDEVASLQQEAISTLSAHENLQEILATIRKKAFKWQKEEVASRALETVVALYNTELEHFKTERNEQERRRFTSRFMQSAAYLQGNQTVQRIKKLEAKVRCLTKVNRGELVHFLIEQASKSTGMTSRALANQPVSTSSAVETTTCLQVPSNFQCPISYELCETPVVAEDGFTYDKTNIERWFQTTGANTSPMTGLPMGTSLLPNRNLSTQIREWLEGVDIIRAETQEYGRAEPGSTYGSRRGRGRGWGSNSWRSGPELVKLRIIMDTKQWEFRVPRRVRYNSLKALAFRCLKGETSTFTLLHNGEHVRLETWSEPTVPIQFGMTIAIHKGPQPRGLGVVPVTPRPTVPTPPPERVLVKVYRYHTAQPASPVFTFWILRNTQSNVSSVLFQYWTHNSGNNSTSPDRFVVWADISYKGDGTIAGHSVNAWRPLSEVINQYMIQGTTEDNDPLYHKVIEDESESADWDKSNLLPKEKNAKVLKLLLLQNTRTKKSKKPVNREKVLTRMDVMKQVFDNYINRAIAYDISNHIGLITFATKPAIKQNITGVVENFRHALNNLQCGGDTAMWDALKLAAECIDTYGAKYPEAKKRIVCLSDGADTNSKTESWRLCMELQSKNIVVDSIRIGIDHANNGDLLGISYGTGGYKFFPRNLDSAVAICELETVLSQSERPEIPTPDIRLSQNGGAMVQFRQYSQRAVVDIVNEDVYPPRKSHPNLQDEFIELSAVLQKGGNRAVRQNAFAAGFRLGDARLLHEMRLIASNNQPYYDVYASESNMRFWKIVMEAPPDSPYAGGTYLLYLDMDADFPRSPPKARFVTPILHPNINKHGRICHSILDRDWTTDTTLSALLNVIWSLLLVPIKTDFANVVVSLNYMWDEVGHQERVKGHVQKHATKTREQWKEEIIGSE